MTYQPPVGVWKTTPARRLLWAAKQVHLRLAYELPEKGEIAKWEKRLYKLIAQPVLKYPWERWYRDHDVDEYGIAKAQHEPPDVPPEILAAWAKLPDQVQRLWMQAAEIRVKAEGLPFDRAAIEYGLATTMHLITGIPDTERAALRGLMQTALDERQGQFGFAKAIRERWTTVSRLKAEQIAVTEWNRGASAATFYSYRQQGVDKKAWFTAGDDRVCEQCEANAADGEIPINQEFFSGDLYPPAHPSCRCNISSA